MSTNGDGKNKKNKSKIDEAFEKFATLISDYVNSQETELDAETEIFFEQEEQGQIALQGELATSYRALLSLMLEATDKDDRISPKSVEKILQRAMLVAVDPRGNINSTPLTERINDAVKEIKKALGSTPVQYQVFVPIRGLLPEDLPFKIGQVTFLVFDNEQYAKFKRIAVLGEGKEAIKKTRLELLDRFLALEVQEKVVAVVQVNAKDNTAARLIALKEVRLTIDALNFFSDLIPYSHGHLYMPGDVETVVFTTPSIIGTEEEQYSVQTNRAGPLSELSAKKFQDSRITQNLGLNYLSNILARPRAQLNALEKRLLAAVQWAGRATTDTRNEEAFLLYAIALESIVLADANKDELLFRLKIRAAHLFGGDLETKKRTAKRVGKLYEIRSSIVHNGTYEVLDRDVSMIRFIAKNCIIRFLVDTELQELKNIEDFTNWFNEQMLK